MVLEEIIVHGLRWHFLSKYQDVSYTPNFNEYYRILSDGSKVYINDNLISSITSQNYNYNLKLYVFARNNSGVADCFSITKLKSISIEYDGQLVRDFIPVLDLNDKPALYDKIEGKFYYNQGTGEFIAGPNVD